MFRRIAAVMSGALPFSDMPMAHMPVPVFVPSDAKPAPPSSAASAAKPHPAPTLSAAAAKAEADALAVLAWARDESPAHDSGSPLSAEESRLYRAAFGEV